ncbi:MAG: chromosomal replication initiator protein DnaA, partial [Phycisphaerales bacterium]
DRFTATRRDALSASPRHPAKGHATKAQAGQDPDREVWRRMLAHLKTQHHDICRQWFEELEPMGINTGVFRLRAHSNIHRDYLQRQCLPQFSDAARTASGRLLTVRFLGPEDELKILAAPAPRPAADALRPAPAAQPGSHPAAFPTSPTGAVQPASHGPAPAPRPVEPVGRPGAANGPADAPHRSSGYEEHVPFEPVIRAVPESAAIPAAGALPPVYDDGLVLNPDSGFENFVVGPGSRLAHAAALAVADKPGRAYNPYFVHGGVGLGKTHLLQAICLSIRQHRPEAVIYYTSCEGFMTQFMDAVAVGAMSRFRYKFRHVDVLVVDDIHFLAKRDRTQEEFFHTFNSLFQSHKQIVLSSDASPDDIPDLEDRLVSRFKWGLVTTIQPPCYETRVEILKSKARLRGVEMPPEVAAYVAGRIDSNIRELEGAIGKLQAYSSVEKQPITEALARAALGGDDEQRAEPRVQIHTIVETVTEFYGVKTTDLQSKRRQRSIALPRQLCMFLARRHTRFSLEEIGGHFGGRDHTTVMHAVRTIEERRRADDEFDRTVKQLEEKMRLTPSA